MVINNFSNYFKIAIDDREYLFSFVLADITDVVKESDDNKRKYKKLINDYFRYIKVNYGDEVFYNKPLRLDSSIIEDLKFSKSSTIDIKKNKSKLDKLIKNAIFSELKNYEKITLEIGGDVNYGTESSAESS